MHKRLSYQGIILAFTVACSGCSVLIGNVNPITEKSEAFEVLEISKADSDWYRLKTDMPDDSADVSDMTFQSHSTASIISINSACRNKIKGQSSNLKLFTNELLYSVTNMSQKEERHMMLDGRKALETTVLGNIDREQMKLRTVVLKNGACIYDLMYVSRPDSFDKNENLFSKFVSSLRLE